ncbi:MFS transporter [Rhodobacteraceae bacterium HSP-20]|uniref:MFS transporter n=1 Tax=Paragemmobacter amnigenus TaxID=2852097 RepID=A0ABS6J8T9_9RHOB|nr:MFS transporter [Rhodobacter amnigenus]MBU9700168.1 MFS transporter [Rhodobacter amnigenus]MBV4391395.1 MFS transporter [Rhodobacter amnigenus]
MASVDMNVRDRSRPMTAEERKVILASSAGTIFEWYDFYLYGSLAAIIGAQYFTAFPEATRNVFALLAFAAGFIVRPFGALVFGMLGDLIGRKYTFLMTILIMGLSTFLVGLLPGYSSWGAAAPVILIALRMAQGLALGGEYGGAAVYVAEHAPANQRGYFTAFIQTTATLGLLLSLVVILSVQGYVNGNWEPTPVLDAAGAAVMNADGTPKMIKAFDLWGWRIPFLGSIFLLLISLYIRLQMNESPAFKKMKEEGAASKAPLREAFGTWKNGKFAIIALFGLVAGQAVVWYSGQFYALFFMQNVIKVDSFTANVLVAWSLILGTGGFLFFGALSDRIGRKPIILAGCLIAALTYKFVFPLLTQIANPALYAAHQTPVTVTASEADCSFQFNPTGTVKFTNSCDVAKSTLARTSVNYTTNFDANAAVAQVAIGETVVAAYDAAANSAKVAELTAALETAKAGTDQAAIDAAQAALDAEKGVPAAFTKQVNDALTAAGYPLSADANETVAKAQHFFDIFTGQKLAVVAILTYLILLVTMVYGPIAAMLVELFPTRIRYSGLSLPYHIGNGWFGGLMPATAFAISAQTGNVYGGLWYPIVIAAATVVIGALFVPGGTHKKDIFADK